MNNRRAVISVFAIFVVLFALFVTSRVSSQTPLLDLPLATNAVKAIRSIFMPLVFSGKATQPPPPPTAPPSSPADWTQEGHDAQHTSYTSQVVSAPWHWKWSWNGPTAQGGVVSGKFNLPRGIQPVTGGGRVYVAAGSRGVFALNASTGAPIWNLNPGGSINSTPAYDSASDSLFVVSSNGHLYRLKGASGQTDGDFNGQAASDLPLPPALAGSRVYFSMGNFVYAIQKDSMAQAWAYNAGASVDTPPAYSSSTGLLVAVSNDLFVHAIHDSNGTRAWRVKPTSLAPGDPGDSNAMAEVKYGWPVIAEGHKLVLIKLRLNWQTLWTWNPWPTNNAQMRANLAAKPDQQALFALNLSDGAIAFHTNVGHGGWGDGGRMPMGPQPVVKRFSDGSEVAYVVMRGANCLNSPCDGRWDSRFGEMELDSSTVPGFQAGDVRFIRNTFFPTDEQANLSMSGDDIFGGHWMYGLAHQILDRSAGKGASSDNPITTSNLPHIIESASNCGFSASHYCPNGLIEDGDSRAIPGGFYIYYNQGTVYNQYWSSYAVWVVSGSTVYYLSNDGALIALTAGAPDQPQSASDAANQPAVPTPTPSLDQPISYTQARQYAGWNATVEGEIQFEFNNRKAVLLGFKNPHPGVFKAMILAADWKNFPAPPDQLFGPGQQVKVHGKIDWYQGDPVIYVHDPSQIEVVDNTTTK